MQIKKQSLPKAQIALIIEVGSDEFQPFIQQAVKRISEKISIPGFRAGQAPYDVLKLHIKEMELYEEAANIAIQKTLILAIKQEKINAVGKPDVSVEKLAPNNPFVYKVVLSLLPEVGLPNLEGLPKIGKRRVEVHPDDLKSALLNIQKKHRVEIRKQDAAQNGDKVEVDFEIYKNNVLIENGVYKNFPVIIGEATLIPGFDAALLGLREGDIKKFDLKLPDKHFYKILAGAKATFSVKVLGVYQITLPSLDDAFVQKISVFKTLHELRDAVEKYMLSEQEKSEQDRFEQEMLETIKKRSRFTEIPESLIIQEQENLLQTQKAQMERRGLRFNDYLAHLKKTEETIKQEYRTKAIERVKYTLLLREIEHQEHIQVTEQDIEKERGRVLQTLDDDDAKAYFTSKDSNQELAFALKHRKIVEFLQTHLEKPAS